jgi:CIC family chloride channel protein
MASFISAGYKTPLAAVVFVAEATGGHAFIIPALIGAAVAYAISGDASASGDQRLHEGVKVQELRHIPVSAVMQQQMISAQASLTLREFTSMLSPHTQHEAFPVFDGTRLVGAVSVWSVAHIAPERWDTTTLRHLVDDRIDTIPPDCDVNEALRMLLGEHRQPLLLVVSNDGTVQGIVTKTDILQVLQSRTTTLEEPVDEPIAIA